jgi:hypothetical protein
MLAMKAGGIQGRGKGDFLASRDFGDIVTLLDGRSELLEEVAGADDDVRACIAEGTRRLLATLGSWTDSQERYAATPRARNASTSSFCPPSTRSPK